MGCKWGNKVMRLGKNSRGFTLLEIMMVVAVLGIALSMFYNYLNFNFKFLNERNQENESYLQAKVAMNRLVDHLQSYQTLAISGNYIIGTGSDGNSETLFNYTDISDKTNGVIYYSEPFDTSTGIGQLNKSGNIIAKNIKVYFDKDTNNKYIQITLEVFPDRNLGENSVKLSTIARINHKRDGLEGL